MLQRLLPRATRISGERAEAVRAYIREQLRIIHPEEVEPFRRWSDLITYYRGIQTESTIVRDWLLPATRHVHDLMATWVGRNADLSVPSEAAALHQLRATYYRSGEEWLVAMTDSLEHTLQGDPSAKRRHHTVTPLATKHQKARIRAEAEMQSLVRRLP